MEVKVHTHCVLCKGPLYFHGNAGGSVLTFYDCLRMLSGVVQAF